MRIPKRSSKGAPPREKAWLKSLTDRIEVLERWFLELDREKPRRVTAKLVEDALKLATRTRDAIAAKRFEAVILYYELEDLHRFLAEQFEIREVLSRAKRDSRYLEGRWNAAHAKRPTIENRRNKFKAEVQKIYVLKKPTGDDLRQLAEQHGIKIAGRIPNEKTLRGWLRPTKRGN